jgi:hypothetical protein
VDERRETATVTRATPSVSAEALPRTVNAEDYMALVFEVGETTAENGSWQPS